MCLIIPILFYLILGKKKMRVSIETRETKNLNILFYFNKKRTINR